MPVSINPATGEQLATYPLHTADDVDVRLSEAVLAQREWRREPTEVRCRLLSRLAGELRADRERFARAISQEMGKPVGEARAEVDKSVWALEYYAAGAERFLAFEPIESAAATSGVTFEPLGVVLAIMPWNYPFWQFFRFAAPALAAGNGAVLKHASNVSGCALLLEEIYRRAGGPQGLFSVVRVEPGDVAGLIADERIAAVALTGSSEVGAVVAAHAGGALKKQVLELGGSDPFIVLADADIGAAARAAVAARFTANGQSCVNAKRFLVEADVADEFVGLFVAGARKLTLGDPLDEATTIGPLARADLRTTLHDQVRRSVAAGAVVRIGGQVPDRPGFYYPPTILDAVTADQPVFTEETFGPVAAVTRVADAEEAVALANATQFGLGAALWTADIDRARELVSRIDAGAVFVNGQVASDPRLPFGGIKRSGYGRELGSYGIREFVNIKTVWIGHTA
ncbi:NAD-dependent succinate-semialdehyde dehydrogenase [Myceligenerans pegani]|uniref:NAD-dependent succinate-semialdehyde dehydrogenase n=1 Tax=Myceligenerans pegani TaxID=2776917 RepID=A0ABR9N5K5_9MICO|nr:NAD-dependent succinate-semialdehyde dehydrogenase [Myceligenerans sp. TRM 65318]MBE1878546.1 NAD-dependent succinate-semialdehyde dehydrogenase [Myceligenerans sp. TRM 65318]MBE3020817.1 NAD-dependent succinate-semialdehyde dehydrogenase [Myceligenerans sp. TRM 65318]